MPARRSAACWSSRILNPSGELPAFFVDSQIEQTIEKAIEYNEQSSHINLAPQKIREILDKVTRAVGAGDSPMAVVTSSSARYYLRQMIEGQIPNLSVLSHNEIPPGVSRRIDGAYSMRLKSYFSGTVEAAMELAHKELGEEALLINARPSTPETRSLGAYEVVFGVPPKIGSSRRSQGPQQTCAAPSR